MNKLAIDGHRKSRAPIIVLKLRFEYALNADEIAFNLKRDDFNQ